MNFELIDNCFQIAVLFGTALAAIAVTLRHKDRRFLMLALFYICISMGTLYWVLHLFILGNVPQVFYVSEFSWLASYPPLSFSFPLSLVNIPSFFELLRKERHRHLVGRHCHL